MGALHNVCNQHRVWGKIHLSVSLSSSRDLLEPWFLRLLPGEEQASLTVLLWASPVAGPQGRETPGP